MSDYLVRATAADLHVRAFAATTRDLVEYARAAHNTSPVITAALGRLLTGGVLMGATQKGDADIMTIKVECDGPAKGLCVTADSKGNVKGYAIEPQVMLPARAEDHKLDVKGAIGHGSLQVIKDIGLKDPYVGQVDLISGEIAEDLTYYYAMSEQTPSSVGLGVLMDKDNTVRAAGGFMLQLMPDCSEEVISTIEKNLAEINSVTALLNAGKTPEDILEMLLGNLGVVITEREQCQFHCNCSKERFASGLISLGSSELQSIIDEGQPIEVNCHFCNKNYNYDISELKKMLQYATGE